MDDLAEQWNEQDRPRLSGLASGRTLKRFERAGAASELAGEYLRASRARRTLGRASAGLGVLVLATAVGLVLKRALAPDQPHPAIDNLNARVRAWWLMVAVIGLALLAGKTGVILLFAFASFTALREYTSIAPTRRSDHLPMLLSFFVAVPFQYLLVWMEWYGFYTIFIPVYCFLVLPTLSAMRGEVRDFMQRARRQPAAERGVDLGNAERQSARAPVDPGRFLQSLQALAQRGIADADVAQARGQVQILQQFGDGVGGGFVRAAEGGGQILLPFGGRSLVPAQHVG